jgi:alpha-ribazole phosphatase
MRAAVLERGPWDRLVSSPLQRCSRFAEELGTQLGLPVQLDKDLQELHFGTWEGQSAATLMETDAQALGLFWADPYSFTPPEGERVEDFSTRVSAAVGRLQASYAGQRILLISHGGVMRLLLAQARGLPREQLLNVEVGHGALFSLAIGSGGLLTEAN